MSDTLDTPKMGDEKWTEYVLSLLRDDEKVDGAPKADGLRRLTRELVGPILNSKVCSIVAPTIENRNRATVEYEIKLIALEKNALGFPPGICIESSDIADVSPENTVEMYCKHPSATAATRAEGRVLRKILGLQNICSAEELTAPPKDQAVSDDGFISDVQIKGINVLCKRSDIDVLKFINSGTLQYDNINQVRYETALKMIETLNAYSGDKTKIPQSLIGYNKDWSKV